MARKVKNKKTAKTKTMNKRRVRNNKSSRNKNKRVQRITRKNYRKNRKNMRKRRNVKTKMNMKGGAIPFSELANVYDEVQFKASEFISPFFDKNQSVPGNPVSNNPNVTHQFDRVTETGPSSTTPDIKTITERNFST